MFFFPRLVEERKSGFNGKIQVYKLFGKYSICVDNLTQSGGLLVPIWKKALRRVFNFQAPIFNCLILGLGGGTAARLVSQYWPGLKITAIEIDPVMVELARKYHQVDKIKNLTIVTGDAFKQVYNLKPNTYNLILVDTYQGKTYPKQAKSEKFFRQLKKLLSKKGMVIFNRLNWERNDQDIENHISLLKKQFPQVEFQRILSNTLVFCSLQE